MDKDTRNAIDRATQRARRLLEDDFAAQLEGDFDVHRDGRVAPHAGKHLSPRQVYARERVVAAIEHKRAAGMSPADAVRDYLRDAAFTTLNRFAALKMLEARELVQECVTRGEQSAGYREFYGMAAGLPLLPESAGYRIYIESLFDELSTEVKVLFDRRDPSSVLWPKRASFDQLLALLNAEELAGIWREDETIGWVYQFFNGQDERKKMREESQAPRNSRELAVRNQFFTPRYVVQFLTDNTLGRIWYEMRETQTALAESCEYMVRKPDETIAPRAKKDPRDLRVLDPACGSGHFLLYTFDLLLTIYKEAHADPRSPKSDATGRTLAEDHPSLDALKRAVPGLILAHNLHGVDIDPRCAQIAQLALWMRAQRAYRDDEIPRAERPPIRRSNIVVAEPLVARDDELDAFCKTLNPPLVGTLFRSLVEAMQLAGDLGTLLPLEKILAADIAAARKAWNAARARPGLLPGMESLAPQSELDFERHQQGFFDLAAAVRTALDRYVGEQVGASSTRRRVAASSPKTPPMASPVGHRREEVRHRADEPPVRIGQHTRQEGLREGLPTHEERCVRGLRRTRDSTAVVPRSRRRDHVANELLSVELPEVARGYLVEEAPPVVFADLGAGVLDSAMVETAAYCLEVRA
ncbi:MAG: DNA methyltransferase [Polyangiales bacterium]